jgi:hypothetical protein
VTNLQSDFLFLDFASERIDHEQITIFPICFGSGVKFAREEDPRENENLSFSSLVDLSRNGTVLARADLVNLGVYDVLNLSFLFDTSTDVKVAFAIRSNLRFVSIQE